MDLAFDNTFDISKHGGKLFNDLANSKEVETLITIGKAGGEFLEALVKFSA